MAILKGIRHPITTGKKRFIQNIGLEFLKPTAVLIARLFNLIKVPDPYKQTSTSKRLPSVGAQI
jgi:hypothetical protein